MFFDFPTQRRQQSFVLTMPVMTSLVFIYFFLAKTASFYRYKIT